MKLLLNLESLLLHNQMVLFIHYTNSGQYALCICSNFSYLYSEFCLVNLIIIFFQRPITTKYISNFKANQTH